MDKLARYRGIVEAVVRDYVHKPFNGEIECQLVIDRERDHYLVVNVGWDRKRRVDGTSIHLDIIDGKVWIQWDGTNRPIADELLAAGIPREDIVLGFQPPHLRQYTDFAVA